MIEVERVILELVEGQRVPLGDGLLVSRDLLGGRVGRKIDDGRLNRARDELMHPLADAEIAVGLQTEVARVGLHQRVAVKATRNCLTNRLAGDRLALAAKADHAQAAARVVRHGERLIRSGLNPLADAYRRPPSC